MLGLIFLTNGKVKSEVSNIRHLTCSYRQLHIKIHSSIVFRNRGVNIMFKFNEDEENLKCSFCGKDQDQVKN